jgi:6-phospho-3-hexuloisomerase
MLKSITKEIEKELKKVLDQCSEKETTKLINLILKSKRTFLTGQGRSGLIAKAFAMRLMQLNKTAYVVGESITPAITSKDLLIAISGSGQTEITKDIVHEAKKKKAKIALITANQKAKIPHNILILIKAKTKLNHKKSIEPLGSLFEQASLLYLDSIIIILMKKLKKTEKSLKKRHSDLE